MPVRSDTPSASRTKHSEFDRRAISVAGHLLMGGVWIERQLVLAPKLLGGVFKSPEPRPKGLTMVQSGRAL
jgi:hypothetical protein